MFLRIVEISEYGRWIYLFVTECPSGTASAEGLSFEGAGGGGAFVRLVASMI